MGTIEIDRLSRRFGGTAAVDDISLTIEDGEFLVLLGPSGCGKSTLLRMLAGLLEPTSGSIVLDGRDITREPSGKRDLAMVFQSYALYPHLTVANNLAFPLRTKGMPKAEIRAAVERVATTLQIEHLLDRRPKQLSGGQRQRVAVGRALVREPRAYLMDEPLSNLDAKLRTATRRELTSLHGRLKATFVYVTHDQVEAMTMATRIAVLNAGRLEQIGTPEEIYDRPGSVFVAGFVGSTPMNLLDARVATVDGMVTVQGSGLQGKLWAGDTDSLEVVVGVRPEQLQILENPPAPAGVFFSGAVDNIENLGHEQIVHTRLTETTVAVRTPRRTDLSVGQPITVWAHPDDTHLFDRASGQRLSWIEDPAVYEGWPREHAAAR